MSPPTLARVTVLLLLLLGTGCAYLGDRALDAVDPYRISIGGGTTVGIRACGVGVYDTGLMIGVKPNAAALGLRYGKPLYFDRNDATFDADQAEIIKTSSIRGYDYAKGDYESATGSAALFPAVFTWTDAMPTEFEWTVPEEGDDIRDVTWLWSPKAFKANRYAQIHAFDIELDIGLGLYLEQGFSPGELLDFFLGFLLIDISADDGRLGGGE